MAIDVIGLISSLNPTVNEIVSLFKGFSHMSPNMSSALLKAMDENMLAKIAEWAQTFIKQVNDLGSTPNAADTTGQYDKPSGDFFDVMKGSDYQGPKLTAADLEEASNKITKAIKENDWEQAIQVGIGIAKYAAVLA